MQCACRLRLQCGRLRLQSGANVHVRGRGQISQRLDAELAAEAPDQSQVRNSAAVRCYVVLTRMLRYNQVY